MSVRHIRGSEDWYVITADRDENNGRPAWLHRGKWLHGPKSMAHAEWNILGKHNFGYGFEFGRNGGESDIGLSIYAGPVASVWLRLSSPWTKWARVRGRGDGWYHARHTGVMVRPHNGCWFRVQWDSASDGGRKLRREWSLQSWKVLGRQDVTRDEIETGVATIPLPEGSYTGTYKTERVTRRYVRWPGKAIDMLRGPQQWTSVNLDIEGGIPIEGKGENSYDCGMDGLFGCSGKTVEDAVGHAVEHVLKYRKQYGGPHNLTRPMTVREAESA